MRDHYNIAVVTNDIFTKEDQEFLIRNQALSDKGRIRAIETGGCPHAAIREDVSANIGALEELQATYGCDMLFVESGGDNLAGEYTCLEQNYEPKGSVRYDTDCVFLI